MRRGYEVYENVSKDVLDSVQVGDLVKFNDWKIAHRVKGVSDNYFVTARNAFGQTLYSVCEKKPWPGIRYNAMVGGMFHIGPDNMIFGWTGGYDFDDADNTSKYLEAFESGKIELSMRRGCPVYSMAIKRHEGGADNGDN